MKVFDRDFQHKILNLIYLTYALITLAYWVTPLSNTSLINVTSINFYYGSLILTSVLVLIFNKKIGLSFKAIFISSILIVTGLLLNYLEDAYKGYLLVLIALLIISLVLKQRQVYFIFGFTVLSMLVIGIMRNMGFISNYYTNELIHTSWQEWIEKMTIFFTLSLSTTWALTSLRMNILKLVTEASQEKIKYKPLFDQTYSFISMLDNTGHVIESNEAALYYIQSKLTDVKNIYFPDTRWWTHSKKVKDEITRNLESSLKGDFRRFEITHRNIDGETEYFDYTLKPIFDNEVGVKYIIAEGRNITEFKRARQALIEGEERLLALTESTYEGLIISNAGIIVEANKSALKLFKLKSLDEIIGKDFYSEFIHPEDRQMVIEKINENFTKPFETKGILKDKTIIPIEIEGRDIIYKGKLHRVSAIRDLTERRLAQKALINSEEKYRLITENINDIVCKLDEKLHFTYTSSSVYNMLGYTVNEMARISLKEITTKESYYKIVTHLNQKRRLVKTNSKEVWASIAFEAVLKHKSGRLLWTHLSAKLIKWGKNNTYEILCVARNIDAIKKIQFSLEENENRLLQQNEEYERLNKELIDLNEKLLQAKHKAEESDKLKSAFLANMSHEIRTPMNSIIGFSRMFKNKSIEEEKRDKYADYVIDNGKLLLNIVNDILDLSKIESGQIQLKKETFNLNLLFNDLYQDVSEQNSKGLMILKSNYLKDEDAFIYEDKNRLSQVLWNLINNAYKFTKKGGITFGYQIINNNILFYIKDTGIGIPSEQQEKIFERFRQVEMEASRVFGGAGLGLSISQKVVELMHGKIWLNSDSGHGSTFYVSIPYVKKKGETISQPVKSKQQQKNLKESPQGKKQSILVAEDDESNFYFLNELLVNLQYSVKRAKNGAEAVELCKTDSSIGLVFMDIKMPVMDGYEATKQIKEVKPQIPIIAQTAFAMADDQDTAIQKGCDDYLSKPIDPEVLLNKLKKHMPA